MDYGRPRRREMAPGSCASRRNPASGIPQSRSAGCISRTGQRTRRTSGRGCARSWLFTSRRIVFEPATAGRLPSAVGELDRARLDEQADGGSVTTSVHVFRCTPAASVPGPRFRATRTAWPCVWRLATVGPRSRDMRRFVRLPVQVTSGVPSHDAARTILSWPSCCPWGAGLSCAPSAMRFGYAKLTSSIQLSAAAE